MTFALASIVPNRILQNHALAFLGSQSDYGNRISKYIRDNQFASVADIPFDLDYDDNSNINSGIQPSSKHNILYPGDFFEGCFAEKIKTDDAWIALVVSAMARQGDIIYVLYGISNENYDSLNDKDVFNHKNGNRVSYNVPYVEIKSLKNILDFISDEDTIMQTVVLASPLKVYEPSAVFIRIFDRDGTIAFIKN